MTTEPNWNGYDLSKQYDEFTNHLKDKGFELIGEGSFRRVYARGKVVVKVPYNTDGLNDNRIEHKAFHTLFSKPSRDGIQCAPCRLLPNGCLMMVRMENRYVDYPKWASRVDGKQVGIYKGRVVAYDYALDLTERFEWESQFKLQSEFFNSESWYEQRPHIVKYLKKQRLAKTG